MAGGGLEKLREAGKADNTGPVLSLFFAQTWRATWQMKDPNMSSKPKEMAEWVESQAYDIWKKMTPTNKSSLDAFSWMN
jgi:hypothetical protein